MKFIFKIGDNFWNVGDNCGFSFFFSLVGDLILFVFMWFEFSTCVWFYNLV